MLSVRESTIDLAIDAITMWMHGFFRNKDSVNNDARPTHLKRNGS